MEIFGCKVVVRDDMPAGRIRFADPVTGKVVGEITDVGEIADKIAYWNSPERAAFEQERLKRIEQALKDDGCD
jgi:hypothetical protein